MKHVIKLDPSDINKIIADYFKVDKKQVTVVTGLSPVGYGMDARDEPYVRAEVELNAEYFKVDQNQVTVSAVKNPIGYGMDEKEENK